VELLGGELAGVTEYRGEPITRIMFLRALLRIGVYNGGRLPLEELISMQGVNELVEFCRFYEGKFAQVWNEVEELRATERLEINRQRVKEGLPRISDVTELNRLAGKAIHAEELSAEVIAVSDVNRKAVSDKLLGVEASITDHVIASVALQAEGREVGEIVQLAERTLHRMYREAIEAELRPEVFTSLSTFSYENVIHSVLERLNLRELLVCGDLRCIVVQNTAEGTVDLTKGSKDRMFNDRGVMYDLDVRDRIKRELGSFVTYQDSGTGDIYHFITLTPDEIAKQTVSITKPSNLAMTGAEWGVAYVFCHELAHFIERRHKDDIRKLYAGQKDIEQLFAVRFGGYLLGKIFPQVDERQVTENLHERELILFKEMANVYCLPPKQAFVASQVENMQTNEALQQEVLRLRARISDLEEEVRQLTIAGAQVQLKEAGQVGMSLQEGSQINSFPVGLPERNRKEYARLQSLLWEREQMDAEFRRYLGAEGAYERNKRAMLAEELNRMWSEEQIEREIKRLMA